MSAAWAHTRIGSLKHFSRRAAGPPPPGRWRAAPHAAAAAPERLQPGRARWNAPVAGAGQAPQQAGGERRWGALGDGRGTGGWERRGA
jgi:hypothetical protein